MKIKKIHIAGYGHFYDSISPEFSDHVNVIYGGNEAGKTTLMSFFASTIYGLSIQKYPPLQGGKHGGRIFLIDENHRRYTIERLATSRKKSGEFSCVDEEGVEVSAGWKERFATIDKELFESIFWLHHRELEQLPLEKGRLADYLYSASLGVNGANYIETMKKLTAKREELFRKRGKNQPINQRIGTIENLDKQYTETKAELEGFQKISQQKQELVMEIQSLEHKESMLQKQQLYYQKLERAWTYWEMYNQAQEQLNEIGTEEQQLAWQEQAATSEAMIAALPAHRQILTQINRLQTEKQQLEARIQMESKQLGIGWAEEQLQEFSFGLAAKEQIRSTKTQLTRLEQEEQSAQRAMNEAEEWYTIGQEHRTRTINEIEQPQHQTRGAWSHFVQPFVWTLIALSIFIVTANSFWTATTLQQVTTIGAGFFVLIAWVYAFYGSREKREVSKRSEQLAKIQYEKAKQQWQMATNNHQQAIAGWQAWLQENQLPSKSNPDSIMAIIMAIENLQYHMATKQQMEQTLREYEQEAHRFRNQLRDVANDWQTTTENSLLEDIFEQQHLKISKRTLEKTRAAQNIHLLAPPEHTGEELFEGLKATNILHIQKQREEYKNSIAELKRELIEKREQIGKYNHTLEILASDDRLVELSLQRGQEHDDLFNDVKDWTIATMAKWVLEKSKNTFEVQHQPEVIKMASALFASFTESRYEQLAIPIGESAIKARNANGEWLETQQLSQGTKEQLYLSLRLGFLQQYMKHQAGWPIFMDDILVNFDKGRREAALHTIMQLGNEQQVFFFTCHEHLAEAFNRIANPKVKSFVLDRQGLVLQ